MHASMDSQYDLADCQIKAVQVFLNLPSQIRGISVDVNGMLEKVLGGILGRLPSV